MDDDFQKQIELVSVFEGFFLYRKLFFSYTSKNTPWDSMQRLQQMQRI